MKITSTDHRSARSTARPPRAARVALALLIAIASWPGIARAAALVTTGFGSDQVLVYPTPNAEAPNPVAVPVSGLPGGARPRGVTCIDANTCLVADSGNFRVFVVSVSTASVVGTIETAAGGYSGMGTLAANPQGTFALALDPFAFVGQITVIHAPFGPGSTITRVPFSGAVLAGGTQSIAFAPSGRAFVCLGGSVAVLDPPYAAIAFSMPLFSGCSELATSPDGNALLAPQGQTVNVFAAPFSSGSTASVLSVPGATGLVGAAVAPDGATALVADANGHAVWAVAAPFGSGSAVQRIALPPGTGTLRQIAISPDNQLAIAAGGGANPRIAFLRPPFTTAGASVFDVFILGGSGLGGPAFAGPAGPPGPPSACGLASASAEGQEVAAEVVLSPEAGPALLAAAVLPLSRSVQVGCPATAFVSVLNASDDPAPDVAIAPVTPVAADFLYQTTDKDTNALTGTANTPATIAPRGQQTFVIALTPRAPIDPTDVAFAFGSGGTVPVPSLVGINTLLLSASRTPVPDIVALGATARNTGIVDVPAATNAGAFAVATVNVGAAAEITVSADTGPTVLPLTIAVCQTAANGDCLGTAGPSVTLVINAGATPTFAFFVFAHGPIPLDAAANRIFARFKDAGGVTRGATSVAVQTTN